MTQQDTHAPLSFDHRVEVTRAIFRIIGRWEVPVELQPRLLGLDPNLKRRIFNRYRLGQPLPLEAEVYERVALLLKIDNGVRKLFPHSELSANLWITTPRVKSGNKTPLQLMLDNGMDGIRSIEAGLYNLELW